MPFDPSQAIGDIERSLGVAPAALLAIVLLAGPTVAYLLYHFVVQPRTSRYSDDSRDLLWICQDCRSANDVRAVRCYACGLHREEMAGAVQVVDDTEVVTLPVDAPPVAVPIQGTDDRPLVAVGPGKAPPAEPPVVAPPVTASSEPDPDRIVVRKTPPRRHATAGTRRSRPPDTQEE